LDGEDEAGEEAVRPKRVKKNIKNPNVETDFLPDKEREKEEARERQRLRAEWEEEQERIKSAYRRDVWALLRILLIIGVCCGGVCCATDESVAVTYSYWDGSGHRREITVREAWRVAAGLENGTKPDVHDALVLLLRSRRRQPSGSIWS
jgi:protein FAM50